MSLFIASIASGSNGNCYYIGNHREAVLVDVGVSCREVEKRMKRLNLSLQKVKAIFISHEHSDHIKGVEVLSKKYQLPVFITKVTLLHSGLMFDNSLVNDFKAYEPVRIGDLSVIAFPKLHDASDPHSFIVEGHDTRVGVFTDIGSPCSHVIQNFKICDAVFLEANYDDEMLEQGRYPYYLKKRISGSKGHLSNMQALELFRKHRPKEMSHLFLSHLSRDNNNPELVHGMFLKHAGSTMVEVASRYNETPVYHIRKNIVRRASENIFAMETVQLSLF
jgi:phosphoribosyl 1,2-cyclic phosphodiesterase